MYGKACRHTSEQTAELRFSATLRVGRGGCHDPVALQGGDTGVCAKQHSCSASPCPAHLPQKLLSRN